MVKYRKFLSGICPFLATALILLTAFFAEGLYPFGWGTISWCDMNQQLIPLFCDFKDILSGEKSMFLNFANAGGMNFYGVFYFFLSSPFSFLVAFTEKADIPFLMNILVVLKLSVSGFTAGFVLNKLSQKLNLFTITALSVSYSLCGYGMLFYQNIMWLDMMYLFPIIVLGIFKLTEENRPVLLFVSLTLSVIFNFYISFAIFLFIILYFGVFAFFYPEKDRKIYLNLGICGGASLLVSAVVWVPSLLQYLASARSGGFVTGLKNADFFAPYDTTLTILLCSGMIFGGLFYLLPRFSTLKKRTKFLTVIFLLTAVPLIIEPINLMWHTGSYMSFPARYGFIPVFLGLLIVAKEIPHNTHKTKPILSPLISVVVLFLSVVGLSIAHKNVETLSAYVNTLWGNRDALKGQIPICGIFSLGTVLIFISLKRWGLNRTVAGILLCITVAFQGLASSEIFILSAKDRFSIYNHQSIMALKDTPQKDGFYRVNTEGKITDANMTGAAGFNSLGHYTSLNDKTYMETVRLFGYSGYWMETENWDGSILSDALLSIGYTAQNNNGEFKLIENPYYLSLGIRADGTVLKTLPAGDRLSSLGTAFHQMTNLDNPVTKYEFDKTKYCTVIQKDNNYNINPIMDKGEIHYKIKIADRQTLYFDAYNGFSTNLNEKINNSFSVYVNGKLIKSDYPAQKQNGLLKLGSFQNETVDITLGVLKTCELSSFGVFGISENKLIEFAKTCNTLNLTEKSGKIIGTAEKGNYFISLPYKDNYTVTLNGEKVEYSRALNGFIQINIPHKGQLKISFVPKGFYISLAISLISLALLIVILKTKLNRQMLNNIVFGIFLGVFGAVALWVYIMPIIVNLSDLTF